MKGTRHAITTLVGVTLLVGTTAAAAGPLGVTSTQSEAPAQDETVVGPGEEWILYQWTSPLTGGGIFLIRPDGTGLHQVAAEVGGFHHLATWSPDGTLIGFRRDTDTAVELWGVNADGSGAEMLYGCPRPCNTVAPVEWSPDSTSLYFEYDANAVDGPPTTFGVGRLDLASGTVADVLVREDGMTVVQPRLSPDGSQVVYTRWDEIDDPATGSAIFVADLAGGEERQLTDWDLWAAHPDWGPDGTIAFTTYDLGAFQEGTEPANLYTIAPDGSDLRQLTTFSDHDTRAAQPRWTPDGTGITFTRVDGPGMGTRRMAWIGADGQGMRFLTPEPGTVGTHPELRPVPER